MFFVKVVSLINEAPYHEDVLGMPQPFFTLGKSCRYQLEVRLGGSQILSRRGGEEKNSIIAPAGNQTPVVQLVA
jgi:hypothetical protein